MRFERVCKRRWIAQGLMCDWKKLKICERIEAGCRLIVKKKKKEKKRKRMHAPGYDRERKMSGARVM